MPTDDPEREFTAAQQGAALFDRSAAGKVALIGPEAAIFLHNLCTQDVKNLPNDGGAEAFLTTAKARVVAHGAVSHVLWHGEDQLWFDTDAGQAQRVLQHLQHFLISEQVELVDRTHEVAMLRLAGPTAAALLGPICQAPLPALRPWQHLRGVLDQEPVIVRRTMSLPVPAFDCFCSAEFAAKLREHLIGAGAVPASPQTHEVLRVEAGWPAYGLDMDENRFVVEVGRTAQAICYTKGCFLGQEPIVMARDRGQVNRMLMGVRCGAGPALAAGTKLFQGDAEVGQITSSVVSPRLGQAIALAYVRRGSQEPGTKLALDAPGGGRIAEVCTLPFAFPG